MRVPLDKIMPFVGSADARSALVRLAALLLGGDTAAAETVVRDSFAALHDAWSRLGDLTKAQLYLLQAVVNRSRSVRRRRVDDHNALQPASDAAGAGAGLDRGNGVCALRALPDRQLEAVVLRNYMGLSEQHTARAMGISLGAVNAHLSRGVASLARPRQCQKLPCRQHGADTSLLHQSRRQGAEFRNPGRRCDCHRTRQADVAIHGKEKVYGSIP